MLVDWLIMLAPCQHYHPKSLTNTPETGSLGPSPFPAHTGPARLLLLCPSLDLDLSNMNLLLFLQLLERIPKQMSKGHPTCAFTNTLWPEDANGGLPWAEISAVSTLDLGISHEVFFSVWPHAMLRTEETESSCPHLRGGKALSNPPSPRESKTRDSNSSPWLLTVDLSRTPSSPDTGTNEEKEAKACHHSPQR